MRLYIAKEPVLRGKTGSFVVLNNGFWKVLQWSLQCAFELFEKADIVFGEQTEVAHPVFQVGYALHTHAKGVTRVHVRVDATSLKVVRGYHTATQNLYPAGVLTKSAAFATPNNAT